MLRALSLNLFYRIIFDTVKRVNGNQDFDRGRLLRFYGILAANAAALAVGAALSLLVAQGLNCY